MQRGVRRSVLENRNWSQQSARLSCICAGLVAALELAHVALDLGQLLAALAAALRLRHQPCSSCRQMLLVRWPTVARELALAADLAGGGWLVPGGGMPRAAADPWAGVDRLARRRRARGCDHGHQPQPCASASATDRPSARWPTPRAAPAGAIRRPSGSAFTHWKIPSLAEPPRCRRFAELSGADYGIVDGRGSMQRKCGARLVHSVHRLDDARETADKAPMQATRIRAVNIRCGIIATTAKPVAGARPLLCPPTTEKRPASGSRGRGVT